MSTQVVSLTDYYINFSIQTVWRQVTITKNSDHVAEIGLSNQIGWMVTWKEKYTISNLNSETTRT